MDNDTISERQLTELMTSWATSYALIRHIQEIVTNFLTMRRNDTAQLRTIAAQPSTIEYITQRVLSPFFELPNPTRHDLAYLTCIDWEAAIDVYLQERLSLSLPGRTRDKAPCSWCSKHVDAVSAFVRQCGKLPNDQALWPETLEAGEQARRQFLRRIGFNAIALDQYFRNESRVNGERPRQQHRDSYQQESDAWLNGRDFRVDCFSYTVVANLAANVSFLLRMRPDTCGVIHVGELQDRFAAPMEINQAGVGCTFFGVLGRQWAKTFGHGNHPPRTPAPEPPGDLDNYPSKNLEVIQGADRAPTEHDWQLNQDYVSCLKSSKKKTNRRERSPNLCEISEMAKIQVARKHGLDSDEVDQAVVRCANWDHAG